MGTIKTQGISLPSLGLGTFRMTGDVCRQAVESALGLGYRHIDTAEMYGNEEAVGQALAASGLPRPQLHVTTKVWHENLHGDAMRRSFDASLKRLRLDYVDLYLVHWPTPGMNLREVMQALLRLKEGGFTRAIGVANFTIPMLEQAIGQGVPVACNQVEYHVFLGQARMLDYLRSKAIPLIAYCPLAQGTAASHPELRRIGARHGATAAQVALRWLLEQEGVAAIPKAQRGISQQANLDALDLRLDEGDRRAIGALAKNRRLVTPPFAPRWDA